MGWMAWLCAVFAMNTVLLVIIALREARRSPEAVLWLTVSAVLPLLGFVVYIILTQRVKTKRAKLMNDSNNKVLPSSYGKSAAVISAALRRLSVGGLKQGRVQILTNGLKTYEELTYAIHHAEKSIDIAYYIYRDDQIGQLITDLLIKKAKQGVKVRFIKDGVGSSQFPRSEIALMQEAGIACRTTFPFRFPWLSRTLNYRNHCKIVVIDGREAFTGGINIGDEYTGLKSTVGFWRDTAVRIVGEAAADFQVIFDAHWDLSAPEKYIRISSRQRRQRRVKDHVVSPLPLKLQHNKSMMARLMTEWSAELGSELDAWLDGKGADDEKKKTI